MIQTELIKEIHEIAERTEGVLLSKEHFPVLYQWNAKHRFSLPVHNALAERQFNIANLYLDPNMSEEPVQSTQLFVKNIHQKGVKKLRTTRKTREEYKNRMIQYLETVNHDLIALAKMKVMIKRQADLIILLL